MPLVYHKASLFTNKNPLAFLVLAIHWFNPLVWLAFGESNTKSRIKNILHYKKPTPWMLILGIAAVAILSMGLLADPKDSYTKALLQSDYLAPLSLTHQAPFEPHGQKT